MKWENAYNNPSPNGVNVPARHDCGDRGYEHVNMCREEEMVFIGDTDLSYNTQDISLKDYQWLNEDVLLPSQKLLEDIHELIHEAAIAIAEERYDDAKELLAKADKLAHDDEGLIK